MNISMSKFDSDDSVIIHFGCQTSVRSTKAVILDKKNLALHLFGYPTVSSLYSTKDASEWLKTFTL